MMEARVQTRSGKASSAQVRKISIFLAFLLASVIAMAACGSSPSDSSTKDESSKASSSTSSSSTTVSTTTTTIDPGTLPQTEVQPSTTSEQFQSRMNVLAKAIIANDPASALSTFFPLEAYKQTKAISNPTSDWNSRLIKAFNEDIAAAHKLLGTFTTATFTGVTVPDTAKWIKPGEEYNKGPYWRVLNSKMNFNVDGKNVSVPLTSMISWRGEWYVVHLGKIR